MSRRTLLSIVPLFVLLGCQPSQQQASQGPAAGTPEAKIQNAMSAAPAAIAGKAAIMDWPATEGGQLTELRAGTNGWTCLPDDPKTPSNDPVCLDQTFLKWTDAWQNRKSPQLRQVGFGYMLQGGEGSNTDPYATKPEPNNEWGKEGPHLMMVVPNAASLAGIPTDANSGGPWVMWKGTPYAHVMMPVAAK